MVSSTTYSCLARSLSLRKKTDRIYYPDVWGGAAAGRAPPFFVSVGSTDSTRGKNGHVSDRIRRIQGPRGSPTPLGKLLVQTYNKIA